MLSNLLMAWISTMRCHRSRWSLSACRCQIYGSDCDKSLWIDRQCLSTLLSFENGDVGSWRTDGDEDPCPSTLPVSLLVLDVVIRALRLRRFGQEDTAISMRIGSALRAYFSKPLYVALSQVCYFFANAVGLCVPGSNWGALRLMPP